MVTFVFTDIEGSTRRWERDGAAMQAAVQRHDTLMRAALVAHGGHVFKTIGDAFCAAFWRPDDAVRAMLAAQRTLGAEDFAAVDGLRVRAAIHTGTAHERDHDYFGPTVNRVARLLAIGHGGQVLVSGVTSELVTGMLPPEVTLRDLGAHRLKDLTRPEHVHQLVAPDLPADFPPLRSLDASPNNLPAALTSFVGRETEIGEIRALLESHRLVTLVGSAGIGKTRISLHVAATLIDGAADGVWFIELAPLTSGEYLPSAVAQTVGVSLASDGDPVDNLARALREKHALLIFDNCEHLVAATARVIAALLRACPKITVCASSRQPLGIAGERAYRLPTLAVPVVEACAGLTARDAGRWAAIALFADRARAVERRFALGDDNAPIVADICRQLDGIPLAIELAAARMTHLRPQQLRDRLQERFRLLTGGGRDVLPRQQTLRALIDWSHDLLEDRERTLFRRLGIFINGFTLEGAVSVGGSGSPPLDEFAVVDVLASLVDKSLVLAEPDGDALRYRLLESTRVYAGEKLAAAGELATCAERHLRYLHARFAAARERWNQSGNGAEAAATLSAELEDVRGALDTAAHGAISEGAALLAAIGSAWVHIGLESEGQKRIEATLAALPADAAWLRARLSTAAAWLAGNAGRKERAFVIATEAVRQARRCDDAAALAEALQAYAHEALARRLCDEADAALAEVERLDHLPDRLRRTALDARAFVNQQRGDHAAAARIYEQLRTEFRSIGDERAFLVGTLNLADAEHTRGRTRQAIELVHETLPALRAGSNRTQFSMALMNLAGYLVATDDLAGARAAAREAINEQATREPAHAFVTVALEHLALALALDGDVSAAAALAGYVEAALQRAGFIREFTESTTHERLSAILRDRLAPAEYASRLAEGAALTPEAAIAIANAHATRAFIEPELPIGEREGRDGRRVGERHRDRVLRAADELGGRDVH
jgi:predicted ATPase/class 3 adenylate cyclase